MTVRVGHIGFLNCYPLYYGLEHRGILARDPPVDRAGRPEIELIPGVPTDLNRMLVGGEIDLGPVSSIAYARNHRQLLLSRHVSISAQGAVDSIQLVARRPLREIGSVALTRQSATSVALLKTIFKVRFEQHAIYGELQGSVPEALEQYDAVLLIGDEGLEALHFCRPRTNCHDLGALWQEWTGLPMVYAVWAAREDFARANGPELLAVERELVKCMDYGREHLPEVVDAAAGRSRFDRKTLARYFAVLHYGFAEEYRRGLQRFFELANQAGELGEVPEFRYIDDFVESRAARSAARDGVAGSADRRPAREPAASSPGYERPGSEGLGGGASESGLPDPTAGMGAAIAPDATTDDPTFLGLAEGASGRPATGRAPSGSKKAAQ